jgi:hypothetical protein
MIGKLKYRLILLLVMISTGLSGQNSQVLYFMNLPQNHLLNPALRPSNSVYIGLPVVSGINLNINNNFVNFSDVFTRSQTSDSVISFLNSEKGTNDFLAKIKEKNSIETEVSVQLFGLGFSVGKSGYVFLDINERFDNNIVIPKDIFELALKGNAGFVGSKIDLSTFGGDMKYYHEFGLGYSKDVTSKLRIGVKGKLLFGVAAASINNKALGITVNDDYSHSLDADMTVNFSAPLKVYINTDHNIDSIIYDKTLMDTRSEKIDHILGKKNTGVAFDFGATYDISDKLIVSAAMTDIGFIKWKKDINNLNAESQFDFDGLDMKKVFSGAKTLDEVGQEMLDSLKNSFKASDTRAPFTTFLPFGVTLGGSYNVTKSFSVGVLSYSRFIGKQIRESFTMSANVNFSNRFSTSLSYTAANSRYDNFGAGLAFKPGIFQFYILADRIPIMWNKIKTDNSTIPIPTSWNTINMRFGMNLAFGNRIKKKNDKPMVQVDL